MDFFLFSGIFVGFLVQSIFGFAASIFAFPLILLVKNFAAAHAILSIFYLIFSAILLPKNWRDVDFSIFKKLFFGTFFGFLCGAQILLNFDPFFLKKFFGATIIFYVFWQILAPKKIKISEKFGPIFGFCGGFFSAVFAFSGPFFIIFAHQKISSPRILRATIIAILSVVNFLRAPIF